MMGTSHARTKIWKNKSLATAILRSLIKHSHSRRLLILCQLSLQILHCNIRSSAIATKLTIPSSPFTPVKGEDISFCAIELKAFPFDLFSFVSVVPHTCLNLYLLVCRRRYCWSTAHSDLCNIWGNSACYNSTRDLVLFYHSCRTFAMRRGHAYSLRWWRKSPDQVWFLVLPGLLLRIMTTLEDVSIRGVGDWSRDAWDSCSRIGWSFPFSPLRKTNITGTWQ